TLTPYMPPPPAGTSEFTTPQQFSPMAAPQPEPNFNEWESPSSSLPQQAGNVVAALPTYTNPGTPMPDYGSIPGGAPPQPSAAAPSSAAVKFSLEAANVKMTGVELSVVLRNDMNTSL